MKKTTGIRSRNREILLPRNFTLAKFYSFKVSAIPLSKAVPTSTDKNNETNENIYQKVAFLMYTEIVNFRSQSLETASKLKPHRGLGTKLPSS